MPTARVLCWRRLNGQRSEVRMKAEIYYFSGTGNSLTIAKELAGRLDAGLISIHLVMSGSEIQTDADIIGIVFPVYYGELPAIVKNFASGMVGIGGKYIFAVCNFGGAAGGCLDTLKRILTKRGGMLSAGYGIHMPQNAFLKPWEKHGKVYASCRKRIDSVIRNTRAGEKGMFLSNPPLELLMRPMYSLLKPMYTKKFVKLTGAPPDTGLDKLIAQIDRSFYTSDQCSGCGLCVKVCPVGNIGIEGGRPVWRNHCENCLACHNWCPNKAIQGAVAEKGYFYRHPDVCIGEMIASGKEVNDKTSLSI